jgi:acetyl esterase/lipase
VAVLVVAAGGCRWVPDPRLADLMLASPAPTVPDAVDHDVSYGPDHGCLLGSDVWCGGSQELDIYRAPGPGGDRPVVVWLHGGGWVFGDKSEPVPANILRQVARGYDLVVANYRLAPAHPFPAALQDVKRVVRWIKAHAAERGWDPGRILVAGHSAGGNLAAMAAVTAGVPALEPDVDADLAGWSSSVTAAVAVNGVVDLGEFVRNDPSGALYAQLYVGCTACSEVADASVDRWVGPDAAPLYLVHGSRDDIARPLTGIAVCNRYDRFGRDCSIDVVDSGPPALQYHDVWSTLNQTSLDQFIDRVLASS